MFALPWGQNRYPEDYKFHNFGRGHLALHHHAFSFSSTCAVVEKKIFENWSILPRPPKAQGGKDHEIHNFCSPSSIDAISQIWLKLVQCMVPEKKLKMFKSLRPTMDDDG
jgi:hypothetical protein